MMQSVGEVMAIGRTFPESLQKACARSRPGTRAHAGPRQPRRPRSRRSRRSTTEELVRAQRGRRRPSGSSAVAARARPRASRSSGCTRSPRSTRGSSTRCSRSSRSGDRLAALGRSGRARPADWRRAKRLGFGDAQLAALWDVDAGRRCAPRARPRASTSPTRRSTRARRSSRPRTPYHYGTYEDEDEVAPRTTPTVVILGSGPNRIGQGVEFDYCCVHAAFALSDAGFETVMVNCNPETVSTDYDTSDRLFFEPLTVEGVRNVCDSLQAARASSRGVIVALGGQTPLKLAHALEQAGIPMLGHEPGLDRPRRGPRPVQRAVRAARDPAARRAAPRRRRRTRADDRGRASAIPVLVRPSYVLGGRAMQIVYDDDGARRRDGRARRCTGTLGREGGLSAERPALIDRFLEDAIEVDVDALRDATGEVLIGGVMEHIEEAGVHSGDSRVRRSRRRRSSAETIATIEEYTDRLADRARRPRPAQRAVRGQGRPGARDRGEPARQPHRAVREQGDRRPAGQGRGPGHGRRDARGAARGGSAAAAGRGRARLGEGGGAPVQPLPDGRHAPRTGDALDRRGDGHRPLVRARVREEPGRGRGTGCPSPARSSSRSPTATRTQGLAAARRFAELGFRIVATAGTAAACEAGGSRSKAVVAKVGESGGDGRGRPDLVGQGRPRGEHPTGSGAPRRRRTTSGGPRSPTRSRASRPSAAALAAAAGIAESRTSRTATVRSLQEYHRDGQLRLEV